MAIGDNQELAEIFADQARMNELVDALFRMETAVQGIATKLGTVKEETDSIVEVAERSITDVQKGVEDVTSNLTDLVSETERLTTVWDKVGGTIKGVFRSINNNPEVRKFMANMSNAMTLRGMGNLAQRAQTSPESLVMGMVGGIPQIGPLLQAMLQTRRADFEFEAQGRRSVLQFAGRESLDPTTVQRRGAAIGGIMNRLTHDLRATSAEVEGVFRSLEKHGAGALSGLEKSTFAVEGFGTTVVEAALGVGKAFGTSGEVVGDFAGTLAKVSGLEMPKALELVRDLGNASRVTGLSFQSFVGGLTQATGALRIHRADASDLASVFLQLGNAMERIRPGDQFKTVRGDITQESFSSILQTLQNLPRGLRGRLGPRIAELVTGEQDMDAVEASVRMQTGFAQTLRARGMSGPLMDPMSAALQALMELVRATAPSDEIQQRQLLAHHGFTPASAMLIVEAFQSGGIIDKRLLEQVKSVEDANLKNIKDLEPLKTNTFTGMMTQLKAAVQAGLRGVMSLLSTLLSAVIDGFQMVGNVVANFSFTNPGATLDYVDEYMSKVKSNVNKTGRMFSSAWDEGGDLFDTVWKVFGVDGASTAPVSGAGGTAATRAAANAALANSVAGMGRGGGPSMEGSMVGGGVGAGSGPILRGRLGQHQAHFPRESAFERSLTVPLTDIPGLDLNLNITATSMTSKRIPRSTTPEGHSH